MKKKWYPTEIHNLIQIVQGSKSLKQGFKKAADLYDKFVSFTDDMQGLGRAMDTLSKRYEGAMNKLSEGRGNLVRRAEEFKAMGVQSSKKIDPKLLDVDRVTEE